MSPVDSRFEELARIVCHKSNTLHVEDCYRSNVSRNQLCNKRQKCVILEKSQQQLEAIFAPISEHTFIKSCPGSGKTEVIGLKSAYEIAKWSNRIGGIAVLTFTKSAARVIERRISQFSKTGGVRYPHYVGTIDSWLHGFIGHPFSHKITGYTGKDGDRSLRVVENSSAGEFLKAYKVNSRAYAQPAPTANQYYYDPRVSRFIFASEKPNIDDSRNRLALSLDENRILAETKRRFNKDGFATYQDIECYCYELLKDADFAARISKRFPIIIVDECQDLSWIQLEILLKLKNKGTVLHYVGDLSQAIYEFKRVDPGLVEAFVQGNGFIPHDLAENFRSCKSICDTCSNLVVNSVRQTSNVAAICGNPVVLVEYEKDKIYELVAWFERYLNRCGIGKTDSTMLARSHSTIAVVRPNQKSTYMKKEFLLATAIYLWRNSDFAANKNSVRLMGRFIARSYFTKQAPLTFDDFRPESISSGMKWRLFLCRILNDCKNDRAISNLGQSWDVWAKAVRDNLTAIVDSHRDVIEVARELTLEVQFKKPSEQDGTVIDTVAERNARCSGIPVQTIHAVKGEEYDAVMLISSPTNRGEGHWKKWLETGNDEAARLAYVGSSRAKHLLVWAIPKLTDVAEYKRLEDLGFTKVSLAA